MKFDFSMLERHVADLKARHCYGEAEALLRPFVRSGLRAPIPIWKLLAGVLRQQGKIDETRRIQEMLVSTAPGDFAVRFELAETLLLQGEFERGWREYRCRYSLPHTMRIERKVQCPRWEGEPISGKTLLIHDEQEYGDTFQFLRMVPWARERSGARVILQINEEQLPLATRAGGFDEIISREALPPPFDLHCEMMSLPMAMKLQLEDLPGPIPYLSADPALVERWRERLAAVPRPWVGLHWAGRPGSFNDAARSMSLTDLAALSMPGITFISLQKGDKAAEAHNPPAGMRLMPLGEESRNFEDTAAILTLLDLVISIDSSPVHLAGALGKPAWVLLSFVHDWRWLLSRTDTPWYPTVRLFRQAVPRDWGPVIREVSAELEKFRQR
jgi:hypothetical protein